MNNKGVAPITAIIFVFAGLAVLGGVFYYSYQSALPSNPSATSTSTPMSPAAGTHLSPTNGPIGAVVTIHGSGFAATGNTVLMKNLTAASMKDRPSKDGKTITFTIPQDLGPNCKPNEMCAQFLVNMSVGFSYNVDVVTGSATQGVGTFTVTGK